MTMGIPKISFQDGDSPSVDRATWFNASVFANRFDAKGACPTQLVPGVRTPRSTITPLRVAAMELRNDVTFVSPKKKRRLARRERAQLSKVWAKLN